MSGKLAVDIIADVIAQMEAASPNAIASHVVSVLAASGHTIVPTSESGALQRVRGVHRMECFGYPESFTFCLHCQTAWPCVTIRAAIPAAEEDTNA